MGMFRYVITRERTLSNPIDVLNKVDPPHRIMLFCVPLRGIRVVGTDTEFKTFRVEQLVKDKWLTLSTHTATQSGGSYAVACQAALKAQQTLIMKLQQQSRQPSISVS